MDKFNPSHSSGTYWLMRVEHLALVVACSALALWHFKVLNLWHFALCFVSIDLVGYLPGLLAYQGANKGRVAPIYHYLYNVMHSFLTWGVVVGLWAYFWGWEWAMLAIPIHLGLDRGLFGNVFKPVARSFEPCK